MPYAKTNWAVGKILRVNKLPHNHSKQSVIPVDAKFPKTACQNED